MNIISRIMERRMRRRHPAAYWRKKGCEIGEGAEIYPLAEFGSEPYLIKIGKNVRVNTGVNLITHDGGVWVLRHWKPEYRNIDMIRRIKIGDNVHIGTNATIMPGVTIGSNCIIGCGAIVTKDVPDNSICVGVPARVIETLEEYEQKHAKDFIQTKNMTYEEKRKYLLENIK